MRRKPPTPSERGADGRRVPAVRRARVAVPRWLPLAVAALGLLVPFVMLALARAPGWQISFPLDDAWIHLTFARNLARFGDWAYFPGDPVTTGSTSPLFTLLESGRVPPHGERVPHRHRARARGACVVPLRARALGRAAARAPGLDGAGRRAGRGRWTLRHPGDLRHGDQPVPRVPGARLRRVGRGRRARRGARARPWPRGRGPRRWSWPGSSRSTRCWAGAGRAACGRGSQRSWRSCSRIWSSTGSPDRRFCPTRWPRRWPGMQAGASPSSWPGTSARPSGRLAVAGAVSRW